MNDLYKYLDELRGYYLQLAHKAIEDEGERFWTYCKDEYETLRVKMDNDMLKSFDLIINELLLHQLHDFLVAMDGGEWISEKFQFDIINKENGNVENEAISLHDQFIDYLWNKRDGDPFINY